MFSCLHFIISYLFLFCQLIDYSIIIQKTASVLIIDCKQEGHSETTHLAKALMKPHRSRFICKYAPNYLHTQTNKYQSPTHVRFFNSKSTNYLLRNQWKRWKTSHHTMLKKVKTNWICPLIRIGSKMSVVLSLWILHPFPKLRGNPSSSYCVILLTSRQTHKLTKPPWR